jgi:hypothetical protein
MSRTIASSLIFAVSGLIVSGLGLAIAAGCESTNPPGRPIVDRLPPEQYPKVALEVPLDKQIAISAVNVVPDPVLDVAVTARQITNLSVLNCEYRVIFFDAQGRRLDANPDWRLIRMPQNIKVELRATALDKTAKDWEMQVRLAR